MKDTNKNFWTKTEPARVAVFFSLVTITYTASFIYCLVDEDFADYMTKILSSMWDTSVNLWVCLSIGLVFVFVLLYFAAIDPLIERRRTKRGNMCRNAKENLRNGI